MAKSFSFGYCSFYINLWEPLGGTNDCQDWVGTFLWGLSKSYQFSLKNPSSSLLEMKCGSSQGLLLWLYASPVQEAAFPVFCGPCIHSRSELALGIINSSKRPIILWGLSLSLLCFPLSSYTYPHSNPYSTLHPYSTPTPWQKKKKRIKFKILVLEYKAIHKLA